MKRTLRTAFLIAVTIVALMPAGRSLAEVTLPSVISDHMVIQCDTEVRIWGWAEPGEHVTVVFAGQALDTHADDAGDWSVSLPAMAAAGEGQPLVIEGTNRLEISDVLVGEIWVASGQSNMEWSVANSANAQEEIANANHPEIRMWTAQRTVAEAPQRDVPGRWLVCSPQTVAGFSAVGYYFARDLHQSLDVPVGILHSSWGGTPVESWTSREKLEATEWAGPILERFDTAMAHHPQRMAEYREALARYQATQNGPARSEEEGAYADSDFDDSEWDSAELPKSFEASGLNIDGVVWYRTAVTIPEAWAGKELLLTLGPIDDFDTTYLGGEEVGSTGPGVNNAWQTPRRYTLPADKVAAGEFTLAVRVVDPHGGGGFHGQANQMQLALAGEGQDDAISLAGEWRFKVAHEIDPADANQRPPAQPRGANHPHSPAGLYNGMIAPIMPYTIKGAIWYQGESNAGRAQQYEQLFPAMIVDWRERWGVGEFPFLFVQLANFRAYSEQPTDTDWSHLQWAQTLTLYEVPNTGMAVIIDIGAANDIHPRNKQDVGNRLARWALADTYGQDVVKSGPIYRPGTMREIEGKAWVLFETYGSELALRGGDELTGFTLAGEDGTFFEAQAELVLNGPELTTVTVWSEQVPNPVHVRYAWKDNPEDANLVNEEGLPASPFRTDDLPGPTDDRR